MDLKNEVEELRKKLKDKKETNDLKAEKKQILREIDEQTIKGKIKKRIKDQAKKETKKLGSWLLKKMRK